MKTLPTNPNPDSPIQLTIRPINVSNQSTFLSSQKQLQINTPHSTAAPIQNVHFPSGILNATTPQQSAATISMPRHQSPHHQQASSPSPHHLAVQNYTHNQPSQVHMSSSPAQMSGVPLHVMSPHQGNYYLLLKLDNLAKVSSEIFSSNDCRTKISQSR